MPAAAARPPAPRFLHQQRPHRMAGWLPYYLLLFHKCTYYTYISVKKTLCPKTNKNWCSTYTNLKDSIPGDFRNCKSNAPRAAWEAGQCGNGDTAIKHD